MINRTSPLKVLTIALLSFTAFAPSANANDICDPQIVRGVAQIQKEALEEAAKNSEKLFGGHLDQPDWLANSDGLLTACMSNNWPKINVSQPVLQTILSGAQERATKQACNKAREVVSKATKDYKNMLKSIPGYSQLNGSGFNLGSWDNISGVINGDAGGVLNGVIGSDGQVDWGHIVNSGVEEAVKAQKGGSIITTQPTPSGIPGI